MKILRQTAILAATAALMLGAVADDSGSNLSDLRGLELRHTKIPVLNQGKLQMVIFASSGKRQGELLVGTNTVLAIIRKGAAPDAIRDDWDLVHYPLGSPLPRVLEFWKTRIAYSEGIMNTPEAEIDTLGRRAGGTREVHFRSPLLDLDGVGFEADFDRRTISVNSQVRIVIRQSSANPATLLKTPGRMPARYEYITARGDSLLIDSKRNEVMLIGHVRVDEAQAFLTCDRLTIFWGGERGTPVEGGGDLMELKGSGIESIFADGNVVITRRSNPREQIFADHLTCDVPKGTARLSGETRHPRLVSANGEVLSGRDIYFERNSRRGRIIGDCRLEAAPEPDGKGGRAVRKVLTADNGFFDSDGNFADFAGHVILRDGSRTVSCDRLRVITADRGGKSAPAAGSGGESGTGTLFGAPDLGSGSKDLKSAEFQGHVVLREGAGAQISCDRVHADFVPGTSNLGSADFYGHVEMKDASGSKLTCGTMHADFAPAAAGGTTDIKVVQWHGGVRVESAGSGAAAIPGVITAERGEFDNPGNRVTFEGRVHGVRENKTLDCDRLDIFLVGKKGASPASGGIAIGAGSDREPRKTVATGKVRLVDASGKLDCDKLTLFFTEAPPGAKPTPGMFQFGGSVLTDILAEGHVVAVNRASATSTRQVGFVSGRSRGDRVLYADRGQADLTRHLSHFSGGVRIRDEESQMTCTEMFIYGVRKASPAAVVTGRKTEDPDADPFALPGFTEDDVPSVINISEDVQLKKILFLGDVHMVRIDPETKRKQEAGGSRCVYLPERRIVTLTDRPPRRPWFIIEGRKQYASRILYDIGEGIFKSYDTDTFTIEPGR